MSINHEQEDTNTFGGLARVMMKDTKKVKSNSSYDLYDAPDTPPKTLATPITFEIPITPPGDGYAADTDLPHLHEPRLELQLSNAASLIKAYEGKKVQPITDIKEKLCVTIACGVILIIFFCLLFDEPKYKFIGAQMFCVFFLFFAGYFAHLFKTKYLHRIKIVTTYIAPDFGSIVFPLQIKPYPTAPIKSMSEMFAIRGSQLNHMFGFMCFAIAGIVTTAVYSHLSNLHRFGNVDSFWNKEYIELLLSASSVIAMPLMGGFDLNPNDKIHQMVHYVGVLCMVVSVFPYALQSEFDVYSVLCICGSFGSWLIWFGLSLYYPDNVSDQFGESEEDQQRMREYVHSISVKCILLESIGCCFASMSNCIYIWNLRDVPTY